MIALNKPLTPDLKKLTAYLAQVNESGWYTNFGPLHEQLTKRLESFLGVKNLLLVSNGTLAIQIASKVLGINSAITTPFSFVATTTSLLWQGAEVSFSDIDPITYNLCPSGLDKALSKNNSYDGIVATHVFGNPCDVINIEAVANKYGKKVLYDAAHAFGVTVSGESVLNYGDASTLSFHATKVFHTVEGGAIVFKDKEDFERAKKLINFGIENDGSLGEPGINAKLNEYQCAVGLTLLDEIDEVLKYRTELFELYRFHLSSVVDLPLWHSEANFNGAYMPILLSSEKEREKAERHLISHNIMVRRYFYPSLNNISTFTNEVFACPNSESISSRILCLPLYATMDKESVYKVVSALKQIIKGT